MTDLDTRARNARLEDDASRSPGIREVGRGLFPWLVFFAAVGIVALVMRALFGG